MEVVTNRFHVDTFAFESVPAQILLMETLAKLENYASDVPVYTYHDKLVAMTEELEQFEVLLKVARLELRGPIEKGQGLFSIFFPQRRREFKALRIQDEQYRRLQQLAISYVALARHTTAELRRHLAEHRLAA
mgnify:CR=1 FL=1